MAEGTIGRYRRKFVHLIFAIALNSRAAAAPRMPDKLDKQLIPSTTPWGIKGAVEFPAEYEVRFAVANDYFFIRFCQAIDVPCGIELIQGDNPDDGKRIVLNRTAREILDQLVRARPAYTWKFVDGVLNFYPKPRPGIRSRLDTVIGDFRYEKIWTENALFEIGQKGNLPLKPGLAGESLVGSHPPPEYVSLRLKNATARRALNELVKQRGKAMWDFGNKRPDRPQLFELNFQQW